MDIVDNFALREASFRAQAELIDAIFALRLAESIEAELAASAALIEDNLAAMSVGIAVAVIVLKDLSEG